MFTLSGGPSHRGRSWWDFGAPWAGPAYGMCSECEVDRWAGFSHVHTRGPWECSVGASMTPTEASALLCGWE